MSNTFALNFFEVGKVPIFAFRRLHHAPKLGDRVVFKGVRYKVKIIEWCLDGDATTVGTRLNVIIEKMGDEFNEQLD